MGVDLAVVLLADSADLIDGDPLQSQRPWGTADEAPGFGDRARGLIGLTEGVVLVAVVTVGFASMQGPLIGCGEAV